MCLASNTPNLGCTVGRTSTHRADNEIQKWSPEQELGETDIADAEYLNNSVNEHPDCNRITRQVKKKCRMII